MFPTYAFIVCVFILMGLGFYQQATGYVAPPYAAVPVKESLGLFFVLRAFSAGCTALTGVEAISDGVMAFKPPEWKNARTTLLYLGVILGVMFLGITYLANVYHVMPVEGQTVVSLLGRQVVGDGWFYFVLQTATLLILLLAANTSSLWRKFTYRRTRGLSPLSTS